MIILTALWKRIWPYIAVVGAVLASLFAVRQSGKAAARTEEAAKINKQAEQAAREVRDVQNTVAAMDDDGVDRELDRWVRGPKGRD